MGKKLAKEKEYSILHISTASLKTLLGKTQWDKKTGQREKEYNTLTLGHSGLPLMSTSFGWRIPILYLSFLNVEVGNTLVKMFVRLSLERIC